MTKVNTKPLRRARTASLLALLLLAGATDALASPVPAALARPDTTLAPPLPAEAGVPPVVRRPAASRLRELRGERDFDYRQANADPQQASWWDRLLRWFWRKFAAAVSTPGGRVAWKTLFYGLMAATLVFALLKALQIDPTRLFGRAARAQPLAYEVGQENIHELNFADAIAQAEATGNLRLAVRLGYLQLLKQLTDRDFIAWQPDKTNHTYLHELAASLPAAHAAFAEATRQFEYVWYGELPLPAALYQQVRASQRQLGQQLSGTGRPQFA